MAIVKVMIRAAGLFSGQPADGVSDFLSRRTKILRDLLYAYSWSICNFINAHTHASVDVSSPCGGEHRGAFSAVADNPLTGCPTT
ncbi:MAG: hypothetical protein ACN4GT_05725 [Gammaproteobacteria bacterium]